MPPTQDERPNIILIITDQQRYDTIAELGFPYMDTPNLDRLVREGTTFTNSFITAASCAPARASLFKGTYPHTNGIHKNADTWRHSWVEDLAASGYHCVNIGKMHTYPYETPLGFHERFVVENKDRYLEGRYFFDRWDMAFQARGLVKPQRELYRQLPDYDERLGAFEWELPEELHSDFFVGDMATWWTEHKPVTQPLFLQIGFPGPHPPYDPPLRYAEPYLDKDLPLPDVSEEQLAALPEVQRMHRDHDAEVDHDSISFSKNPTREQLHRQRAYYLANVTMIDEKIGEILAGLEDKGYLDNAVVIFTSDHGDDLSDHGFSQKWTMFDIITRTPLIVWAPGRYQGGRRIDALVQQFDIAPVIMELAGLETPASWETRSLMPLLQDEQDHGREVVYAEQAGADAITGILFGTRMMTMVRTADWKLVHYLDCDDGELYDLVNDPGEKRNLWADPARREKREEMLAILREWHIDSSVRAKDWSEDWR